MDAKVNSSVGSLSSDYNVPIPISEFFLLIILGSLMALDPLTIDMYLPAFDAIKNDFNTSMSYVEFSVSSFFIGMASGQLIYGALSDRFGRRKPLLAGMMIYFFATIGCIFAPNIQVFIACRLLQSFGGCAGLVITRAVIRDVFSPKKVAIFISNMALVVGLAPILAPSIGGFISHHFGWRAIFVTLLTLNFLCMLSIYNFLPETNFKRLEKLSLKSTVKSYYNLFKSKNFVGYLFTDTIFRAGMFAYIAGSPFVFINLLKIPANQYGLVFGLNGVGLTLAAQLNRRLLSWFTPKQILKSAVIIAFIASLGIFSMSFSLSSKYIFLMILFIYLASLNFISPNAVAGALEKQGHQAGVASAAYGFCQWTMASFFSFFVGHFHNGTALPMTGAILACGVIAFLTFMFILWPEIKLEKAEA